MRKLLLVFLLGGCSGKQTTTATIGPTGGAMKSTDGVLNVAVPADALPGNVTMTTNTVAVPPAGAVGTVYDIGPSGTKFTAPVLLTLSYANMNLGGKTPEALRISTYVDGAWIPLADQALDTTAKTISGVTTHLTDFALTESKEVCMVNIVQAPCASKTNAPAGTGSGGTARECGTVTCAEGNHCATYPNAAEQSCNDAGTSYSETCCFAETDNVCLTLTTAVACSGGTNTATTCETQNCDTVGDACGSTWVGSTKNTCAANTDGSVTLTCCYPPGTTPVTPAKTAPQTNTSTQTGSGSGTGR